MSMKLISVGSMICSNPQQQFQEVLKGTTPLVDQLFFSTIPNKDRKIAVAANAILSGSSSSSPSSSSSLSSSLSSSSSPSSTKRKHLESKTNRVGAKKCKLGEGPAAQGDRVANAQNVEERRAGRVESPDGDIYEGELLGKRFHGKGKYEMSNGDVYEGDFVDGKKHGKGIYTWAKGLYIRYEGDFVDNLMEGVGKMFYSNGDVYEGKIQHSLPHGQGRLMLLNGDIYEGGFQYGIIFGKGKRLTSYGAVDEGDYVHGRLHGDAKLSFIYNYEGEFVSGVACGKQKIIFPCGDIYVGNCKKWLPHGKGKMCFSNGSIYSGDFKKGQPAEDCKRIRGARIILEDDPYKDSFNGKAEIIYNNGEKHIGDFVNGVLHGKGKIISASGVCCYQGDFIQGKKTGMGLLSFDDGRTYQGAVVNGIMQGQGKLHYPNGLYYEGTFENNELK